MTGTLDINSPKGQVTLEQERKVIAAIHRFFPNHHYVETDKNREAVNDGVMFNLTTNTITAVCEVKCRDMSIDQLVNDWDNEWLITHKKIARNAEVAREMRVLFTGILYCTQSRIALMKNLYDGNTDKWLADFRTAYTLTRRNINGGMTTRKNAFVDMRNAIRIPVS